MDKILMYVIGAIILLVIVIITIITITKNPCDDFKNDQQDISQECFNKIWKDVGCLTQPRNMGDWHKKQSKEGLINDSKLWASLKDDLHRNGCYGTDKTKWPK
jgi:hypothetical protein